MDLGEPEEIIEIPEPVSVPDRPEQLPTQAPAEPEKVPA